MVIKLYIVITVVHDELSSVKEKKYMTSCKYTRNLLTNDLALKHNFSQKNISKL